FFQAEDGIRDRNVTGVQTCALPIYAMAQVDLGARVHRNRPLDELAPMAYAIARAILRRAEEWGRIDLAHDHPLHPLLIATPDGRSEERRVGKEGRCGEWTADCGYET